LTTNQNIKKLPPNWKWVKLGEVGKIISGGTPSTSIPEYWNGNINWISPSDLTGYKESKIKTGKKSITEFGLKNSSARLMPKGSILFSSRAPIGYVVIADAEMCTNQGFKNIIPNEKINNYYLFYYLKASKQLAESYANGTTFKEISLKSFSELPFPLPPLPTQQAIVAKIETLFTQLDNGIQQLKTAQQQLKTYRQTVLKYAFEGKLTNKNVKDGELPKGWEVIKLEEVLKVSTLKHKPIEQEILFYIGLEHIRKNTGNLTSTVGEELIKTIKNKFKKGDILYGKLRPNLNKVHLAKQNGVCSTDILVLKLSNRCLAEYLLPIMLNNSFVNEMSENTSGVNLPRVSTKFILNYEIPLPPIEEQQLIVQAIESRLSVADAMEQSITQSLLQAEALRQSILKKAFEGRLVVEEEVKEAVVVPMQRKILAGRVIQMFYDDAHFGLTKFQKTLCLVEHYVEVEYEINYEQQRAGPYDRNFTLAFRTEMKEKDWFQEETKISMTHFLLGKNSAKLTKDYANYFRQKGAKIAFVLKLLKDKNLFESELIATLYAVWNNRIIKKDAINIKLLIDDIYAWSSEKVKYSKVDIESMYVWMQEVKLEPKGFGKVIGA
jgi:type I restriction enzyme, S subunit